jgi:hypothetical protein
MLKLPKLKFDTQLNAECRNLTQVAITSAETNFTQGVVLQFRVNAAMQHGASSVGMAVIIAMVAFMVVDVL